MERCESVTHARQRKHQQLGVGVTGVGGLVSVTFGSGGNVMESLGSALWPLV